MSKRKPIDPLANAIANGVEIGMAYERITEASEFGLPEGLTLPGFEDADPPLGRYHGQRGLEMLRAEMQNDQSNLPSGERWRPCRT
jgi:hypothetical protein